MAVDAKFIREIISGIYASDFGLWNTNVGVTVRHKMAIGADNIKMSYNIVPEAADRAVCATTFKEDGIFENAVSEERVREFMTVVKEYRKSL